MTVIQASEREFFGVSSDTKPAAATGAHFYETDTGRDFVYTGSAWVRYLQAQDRTSATHRFIAELLAILGDCRLLFLPAATDTTTSTDKSLNGRTLTHSATIAARLAALGDGFGVSFDGTEYAQTPDVANLSFGTGTADQAMSIVALAKVTDTAGARTLIAKYAGTAREWLFGIDLTDKLQFQVYDESLDLSPKRVSSAVVTQAAPTLYGVTYDGTGGANAMNGVTLYENGLLKASAATNDASYVSMEDTAAVVAIGALSTLTQQTFSGEIHMIAVAQKALTASEHWAIRKLCEGFFNFLG